MADQAHDVYGKSVLRAAAGSGLCEYGPDIEVDYGTPSRARLDGAVGDVAIEVESRTSKQVRGAVLDLVLHPYPKKLLILLPVHMSNPELCANQCRHALGRFVAADCFRVVVASGHGHNPKLAADTALVRAALGELGVAIAV